MILINDRKVEFEKFPNGELKFDVSKITVSNYPIVTLKYEDDSDLIKLFFVKQALDNKRLTSSLLITYMPYSRMDRSEHNIFFTLKYVANFINLLEFSSVCVVEPHSDVTPALLDTCEIFSPTRNLLFNAINETHFDINDDFLFFPDAGAQKRYSNLAKNKNVCVGYKTRNFQTGKIKSMIIIGADQVKDRKVIIVDDLCSYGGTFVMAAKELKETYGAKAVYLCVTHCENSIFEGSIFTSGLIDGVFTTDSLYKYDGRENSLLHVYKLEELL